MHSKIQAFYEFNPLDHVYAPVPETVVKKYEKILPKFLTEIWAKDGLSSHLDGFFWLVNPEEYHDIMQAFIPNSGNLHVILRTAIGGLIYFDESVKKHPEEGKEQYNYLCPIYLETSTFTSKLDVVMNGWLTTEEIFAPRMFYNFYKTARKRLPIPQFDECYGFNPAIALGGDLDSDNLSIFKIKEHLFFLSQLKS